VLTVFNVTLCTEVYVPAPGEAVGVAAMMVITTDAAALALAPGAMAMAFKVVVAAIEIGALYRFDDVVGAVPSVV
jgi:hypothetical protein